MTYDDYSRHKAFDRQCALTDKRNNKVFEIRLKDPTGDHPLTPVSQLPESRSRLYKNLNIKVNSQINVGVNPHSTMQTGSIVDPKKGSKSS